MEDRRQEGTTMNDRERFDQNVSSKEEYQYQPNFQATFTEPVRRERKQEERAYSTSSYRYSDYTNQNNFNQYGYMPPNPPKKKRVWLKIALGLLAAIFIGFGSYGVYDHFFGEGSKSNTVADNEQNTGNDKHNDANNQKDNKNAVSKEDNNNSDVKIEQTTVTDSQGDNKVVTVSENTQPAIVAINCAKVSENAWGQGQQYIGTGSGIIIKQTEKTLLIVTNNHVIEGASNIDVVFTDEETVSAKVKGTDSTSDLAVVEVQLKDMKKSTLQSIKVATLGNSDTSKVGEMVVAIGNALGYGQSVTVGYISAKDREVNIDNKKMILLQTDAAINPGNSGGALLNLRGEVIGINSAKFSSQDVEGMGYAIPITKAIPIINELVDREVLKEEEKGYIGISGKTVTDDMHSSLNCPYGVYVMEVAKDGAADKAGVKVYDIITKLNGSEITTIEGFKERLNSYRAGTEVKITLQRIENGAYMEKTLKVTLQDQKVLNGLQSETDEKGNNNSNDNNSNGNNDNTNPYGDDGSTNPFGDDFYDDDWPWSLFR